MFKTQLYFPPAYECSYPPLGISALFGFLNSKGININQRDLNIEYFDYMREHNLTYVMSPLFAKQKKSESVYYSRLIPDGEDIDYPHIRYLYENNPGSSYLFTEQILSSPLLFRYVKDAKENLFYKFFQDRAMADIKNQRPDLIGLSIIAPSQVTAAFTLGYLIKDACPGIHVTIGGSWVSLYKDELKNHPEFMRFFDTIIFFEGETPLYKLIRQLRTNGHLSKVPNLIYKSGSKFVESKFICEENLDSLPPSDFEGLPLAKYSSSLNKDVILPFETARGCYWNKCVFCAHLPIPKPRYREKNPDLVLRDIRFLHQKYKVNHLVISNPAFSPRQMLEVCNRIVADKIKITWDCLARLDKGFTMDILGLAKKAGCQIINFGLESTNPRILSLMRKGNHRRSAIRIIKDCHNLGIVVYLQVIVGFPTETIEEALDTVKFLADCKEYPKGVVFNIYHLMPRNYIYENPKKYCIRYRKDIPFRFFHKFEHTGKGYISKKCAENLIRLSQKLGINVVNCF